MPMVKLRNIKAILLLLFLPLLLLCGCAAPLAYLAPIADSENVNVYSNETGKFIRYQDSSYEAEAAIYQYKSFFVVDLLLLNKTDSYISEDEYSAWLFDGRDYKPLGRYDKDTIEKIRDLYLASADAVIPEPQYEYKYSGSGYNYYGSSYQSGTLRKEETLASSGARLGATIGTAFKKAEVNQALGKVADKYFSFRSLYSNEPRRGYLCFLADFDIEYPLTLGIVVKGTPIELKFKHLSE